MPQNRQKIGIVVDRMALETVLEQIPAALVFPVVPEDIARAALGINITPGVTNVTPGARFVKTKEPSPYLRESESFLIESRPSKIV